MRWTPFIENKCIFHMPTFSGKKRWNWMAQKYYHHYYHYHHSTIMVAINTTFSNYFKIIMISRTYLHLGKQNSAHKYQNVHAKIQTTRNLLGFIAIIWHNKTIHCWCACLGLLCRYYACDKCLLHCDVWPYKTKWLFSEPSRNTKAWWLFDRSCNPLPRIMMFVLDTQQ